MGQLSVETRPSMPQSTDLAYEDWEHEYDNDACGVTQNTPRDWNREVDYWTSSRVHPIVNSPSHKYVVDALNPYLAELSKPGTLILDVSSGGGPGFYLPAELTKKTIALDKSRRLLEKNNSRHIVAGQLELGPGFGFPLKDDSMDNIVMFFGSRYLGRAYFREIMRVLKPGGRFIVVDHTKIGTFGEKNEFVPEYLVDQCPELISFYTISSLIPKLEEFDNFIDPEMPGPLLLFTGVKKAA